MARTQVLLAAAALLLLCSSFCCAQTTDLASRINTNLDAQEAATQKGATVASTKAAATPTRISQLRDPSTADPTAPTPAPDAAPLTPSSRSAFPGTGAVPGVNTPGGTGAAFPGRIGKPAGATAPAPAAPRTGLPGGYNYAGNNAQVAASRAAATAQDPQQAASAIPAQPKEKVTTQATRSAEKHRKKKIESADEPVGQVTSSNGAVNTAAAGTQPAATSNIIGSFTPITAAQATAAMAQPQAAITTAAAVTTAAADAGAAGTMGVIAPPKNLVATNLYTADGTFFTGDGQVVQKTSQGSVPPTAASSTTGQAGSEAVRTRGNAQVGSIDVDSTSRSALQNSKSAAASPAAVINAGGRRHLAQVDLGAAAQQLLAGFANGAQQQGSQAAATLGAGVSAQPLVGNARTGSSMQTGAASTEASSTGAAAADPSSGVVSGKTYKTATSSSPLTPYNTAMENSIGNVVKQVTSTFGQQPASSLQQQQQQQQTAGAVGSDIPAANQFTQPDLPANRDIISFNVPHPDFTNALASGASALAGRKLQDAAGMISPPQPIQEIAPTDISQGQTTPLAALQHLANTITEATGPTALRSSQSMAAASGFGAGSGYAASSGNAANGGFSAASAQLPTDSSASGYGASVSGAAPFAASANSNAYSSSSGSAAQDASAYNPGAANAGYSAQPMAAAGQMAAATAGGSDESSYNAGRGANAAQSLGGLTGVAINLLNGRRLQQTDGASQLDAVAAAVAKDSAVQATAVSLTKAAAAASGAYWTSAPKDTAAAMKVIAMAVADKATVEAATQLATAVRVAAINAFGSSLPSSLSTAASHLDVASLVQDPAVQSAAIPVLQAAAAAAGNSWNAVALGLDGAAEDVVRSAVADAATIKAARALAQTVISETALMSFGTTLGNIFSGRRLAQANFGDIVHNVATDPAVQAATAHVLEAATTEVSALQALQASEGAPALAPATAQGPSAQPAANTLTALQQLVASVSHNAIATALPFTAQKQASSSSGPLDWEAMLAAPGNAAAAAAAAQKDAGVVKHFDAVETGRSIASNVQGAVAGLLSGAGGRRLAAAAGDGQAAGRALQEGEGLLPNLGTSAANTLNSLSTNARSAGENALIEVAKHVVRTLGVDSNTPGYATPHSQYGYNPIAAVVSYGSSVDTAPTNLPQTSVSTDPSGTVTASALNGVADTQNTAGASYSSASPLAAAVQVPGDAAALQQMPPAVQLPAGATSVATATGRKLLDQAAQPTQQTGPTLESIVSTISSLASAVQTAFSPSAAPQTNSLQGQATPSTTAPQLVNSQGTKTALSEPSFQAVSNNGYGSSSFGGGGGAGGGGKVSVTQASTYAGENGNQLPSNDIHLDGSASNFVIGPDGKVPSLASQGGAAAVAQQLGLLVPNNGAAGSQSVPTPTPQANSGYGGGYGNSGNQNTQQSPSYGYGSSSNQSPGYGYGSNTNQSPTYGYGSNNNAGYGSSNANSNGYGPSSSNVYSPTNNGGTPNTVTAFNNGQSYSGSSGGNNNNASGPTVQGSSYAAPVNSLETQSTTAYSNTVPYNPSQQQMGAAYGSNAMPAGNGWQSSGRGVASYQQNAMG